MKKLVLLLVGTCLILSFQNCGGSSAPESRGPASKEAPNPLLSATSDLAAKTYNLMWYDADWHPADSARPDKGWRLMNPNHPGVAPADGRQYRTTNPLLGLYHFSDSQVAYQHAFWLKSLKTDAIVIDWTNAFCDFQPYFSRVYENADYLMGYWNSLGGKAPQVMFAIRVLNKDWQRTDCVIQQIRNLNSKYPNLAFRMADGTANSNKPLLIIITDANNEWLTVGPPTSYNSDFNVRWTDGYLLDKGLSERALGNVNLTKNNFLYWEFSENRAGSGSGLYQHISPLNGYGQIESGTAWVAKHLSGLNWDGMWNYIDGLTPFERDLASYGDIRPKAMIINRWNYSIAWTNEPQEGISLDTTTMIEPTHEYGFELFYSVQRALFRFRGIVGRVPTQAHVEVTPTQVQLYFHDEEFQAVEYSYQPMGRTHWEMVPHSKFVQLPRHSDTRIFKVRNGFGETPMTQVSGGGEKTSPNIVKFPVTIKSLLSGHCLDIPAQALWMNGNPIQQWRCLNGASNQTWYLEAVAPALYRIQSGANSKCIEVGPDYYNNGARIQQNDCSGHAHQVFYIDNLHGSSSLRPYHNMGSCLDVPSHGLYGIKIGTLMQQWSCNGGLAQQFQIRPL